VQARLPSALSLGFPQSRENQCAAEWRARLLRRESLTSAFEFLCKGNGRVLARKNRLSDVAGRAIVKTASKRDYTLAFVPKWQRSQQYGRYASKGGSARNLHPHRGHVRTADIRVIGRGFGASTVSRLRKCCLTRLIVLSDSDRNDPALHLRVDSHCPEHSLA